MPGVVNKNGKGASFRAALDISLQVRIYIACKIVISIGNHMNSSAIWEIIARVMLCIRRKVIA